MTATPEVTEQQHNLRDQLQDTIDLQASPASIPYALATSIRLADVEPRIKAAGIDLIHSWADYARQYQVQPDPYAIRFHVSRFASQEFGTKRTHEDLRSVSLAELGPSNAGTYGDILASHVSLDILDDPDVAIVGGAARLALKLYAGVDTATEVPISDIDAVVSTSAGDVSAKASSYGVDLAGTKIVDSSVRAALDELVTNFDCTMNQVAVHNGELLFTDAALHDVQEGNIRIIAKLFENMEYENGQVSVSYTRFTGAIARNVRLTQKIIGGTK